LCQLSQRRAHGITAQLPEQFLRVWRRIPAKFYEARSISEFSLFIRPKLTVKFKLIVSFTDVYLLNPAPIFCATRHSQKAKAGTVKNSPHSINGRDSGQGANVVPLAPVFSGTFDGSS
jgi:hypothetical protein